MNSARLLVRTVTPGSSALRNFRYGCSALQKSLSGSPLPLQASQGINRFTPAMCLRMKSTAACKFEVINVQDEGDFKKRVLDASNCTPVVVDFHATWCGPCKILGPRLESILSEEAGKVVMAKVDIDDNADLAMEYGVRSVPTVMAVKNGKVMSQFIGVIDDDQIRSFVDKLIIS